MTLKQKLFFLIIIFTVHAFGQNFEGTLLYTVDFKLSDKSIEKGVTREMVAEKLTKSNGALSPVQYWYKDNNYVRKLVDVGNTGIYIGNSLTLYNQKPGDENILAIDVSIDPETDIYNKPPAVELQDTDVILLGKKCKKVVVLWSNTKYEYYFSPGYLPMNPDTYKNYNLNMWHSYLQLAKALPLRMVKESADGSVIIIMDVAKVEETKVDNDLFNLPEMKLDEDQSNYLPKNQKIYKKI